MPFVLRAAGGAVGRTRHTGLAPVLPQARSLPSRRLPFDDAVHEADEVEAGEPPSAADAPDDDRAPPLACEPSQTCGRWCRGTAPLPPRRARDARAGRAVCLSWSWTCRPPCARTGAVASPERDGQKGVARPLRPNRSASPGSGSDDVERVEQVVEIEHCAPLDDLPPNFCVDACLEALSHRLHVHDHRSVDV